MRQKISRNIIVNKKLMMIGTLLFSTFLYSKTADVYRIGNIVEVSWKGYWHMAKVDEAKTTELYKIHYVGWDAKWDEWVGESRMRHGYYKTGDDVQVLWKNKYMPAMIIEVKEMKYLIHYRGYSKEWDEWVGPERIRKEN